MPALSPWQCCSASRRGGWFELSVIQSRACGAYSVNAAPAVMGFLLNIVAASAGRIIARGLFLEGAGAVAAAGGCWRGGAAGV
jgi:hypothetical protein